MFWSISWLGARPAFESAHQVPADTFQHPQSRLSAHVRQRPVRRPLDLVTLFGTSVIVSNIIMQLANPKVGWGVHESRVDSGSAFHHPVKRARTTGTFLAVALIGEERDVELVRADHIAAAQSWRRSAEGRSLPLPGTFAGTDLDMTLLALGFAKGERGALAVPWMRRAES